MVSNNRKIFCKLGQKASIHISRRSNSYILRGSKVIDIRRNDGQRVIFLRFLPHHSLTSGKQMACLTMPELVADREKIM